MLNNIERDLRGIEDLVLDFIMFRKQKQNAKYGNYNMLNCNDDKEYYMDEEYYEENPELMYENEIDKYTDIDIMRHTFGEVNKRLNPYIIDVLNENEYPNSQMYRDYLDKEYVAQLVDKVIERAKDNIEEVEDIQMEMEESYWGRYRLLRAVIEAALLWEIYGHRRCENREYGNRF